MDAYKSIIHNKIKILREQYHLSNNCGRGIFDFLERVELVGQVPLLFRLPFKNHSLSGFIGFKNDRFSVFLNTNRTLGYEIFTAAHEIYHLIENASSIIEKTVIEEEDEKSTDASEVAADIFASELLMPESDIKVEYDRIMRSNRLSYPDEAVVITLQQIYFVEYKAITKRLVELGLINENKAIELDRILQNEHDLYKLTLKLGYENSINEPTKTVLLPKTFMKAIEENYKLGNTSFEELEAIFGYCDLPPEHFGYEEQLSEAAIAIMNKIRSKLGSDRDGQK